MEFIIFVLGVIGWFIFKKLKRKKIVNTEILEQTNPELEKKLGFYYQPKKLEKYHHHYKKHVSLLTPTEKNFLIFCFPL